MDLAQWKKWIWNDEEDADTNGSNGPKRNIRDPSLPKGEVLSTNGAASSGSAPPVSIPKNVERVYRERVLVRVYDLGKTVITRNFLNHVTKSYGAFHTGVEIYGREWSFGMTFDDWSTGITWNPPAVNPDHSFRETLSMGYTPLSPEQVWQVIEEMKPVWRGCTYNLLTRNCHHFSDTFCRRLGVGGVPDWVNDLAKTGADTVDFLDSADSGYDGGEALFDFVDSVKKRVYTAFGSDSGFDHHAQAPQNRPPSQTSSQIPLPQPASSRGWSQQIEKDPHQHDPFSVLRRR